MSHAPWVLPQILLVLVLVASGLAKVRDIASTRSAFGQLQLPQFLSTLRAPRLLPWGELALAGLILLLPHPWAWLAAAAGLVLMLAYLVIIARAVRFPYPVTCNCFGRLGLGLVEPRTVWRNALLSGIAAVSVWTAWEQGSVAQQLRTAPAPVWWWLLGTAVTVALTWLVTGGSKSIRVVQAPAGRVTPAAAPAAGTDVEAEVEYVRAPTPETTVVDATGLNHSIRDLARREAQLLIFLSPGCGPCHDTAAKMPAWSEQLGPVRLRAVFSTPSPFLPDDPEIIAVRDDSLYDEQGTLGTLLEATSSPSAVLLGTDDLLAGGPVHGARDIAEFVDDVIEQVTGQRPA